MVGFSGKWLYMAATHGSMFIRVQTDHVAVKTDEKRVLQVMGGENLGRTTIWYVTLDKKWKRPTMEWKRFISVGNVVHGTRTWNYVHSGANEPW